MFKNKRNLNRLGVPLYINPNVNPRSLQSEGLVRLAITTLTAFAIHSHFDVTVFVPRKFKKSLKLELGNSSKGKLKIKSPFTSSFTSILNTIRTSLSRLIVMRKQKFKKNGPTQRKLVIRIASSNALLALSVAVIVSAAGLFLLVFFYKVEADALVKLAFLGSLAVALTGVFIFQRKILTGSDAYWLTRETAFEVLEKSDVEHLVKYAARSGIQKWWLPSTMFSGYLGLPGKKVVTFADFVAFEKPSMILSDTSQLYRASEIKAVINGADAIVTLSQYVRETHLPKLLDNNKSITFCIPTGPAHRIGETNENEFSDVSLIAENFPGSNLADQEWWSEPVLTIPSQNRPYKNLEKIVLAAKNLNASGRKIRVVLTCDPSTMKAFLKLHNSESLVEFAHRATDATLQSIISHSTLVCNPSFFEANIPFTLFEGVSLGTPALLADIKSTRQSFAGFENVAGRSLFDPYEISDIEEKISYALNNRQEMLRLQEEFLRSYFSQNSWVNIAKRYESVFEYLFTTTQGASE